MEPKQVVEPKLAGAPPEAEAQKKPPKFEPGSGRTVLRISLGALVVVLGLGVLIWALSLALSHYSPKKNPSTTDKTAQTKAPAGTASKDSQSKQSGTVATATDGGTTATAANDGSAAVVAVMTPITAGILALVGLYFGVSSTGSARGQEAEAKVQQAKANAVEAEATKETAKASVVEAEATKETATASKIKDLKDAGVDPETLVALSGMPVEAEKEDGQA